MQGSIRAYPSHSGTEEILAAAVYHFPIVLHAPEEAIIADGSTSQQAVALFLIWESQQHLVTSQDILKRQLHGPEDAHAQQGCAER